MNNFADKQVYITGGSSGIGLAAARQFFAKGAHVSIFGRSKQRLAEAQGQIEVCRVNKNQKLETRSLDISDPAATRATLTNCIQEIGTPQIFINCAGRACPNYFEDISYEQFDETMKVNLYGIWNTLKTVVPFMKEQGSGHIVNTSSVAGFIGVFGYTDYSASKYAIWGLSATLASELKSSGIRVSILCPPDTETPGFHEENKTKPKETKLISEMASLMSPEAVAKALLKGMAGNKEVILPGSNVKTTYYMSKFLPCVVNMVMNKAVRRVQNQKRG